jgi:hypothetical protein
MSDTRKTNAPVIAARAAAARATDAREANAPVTAAQATDAQAAAARATDAQAAAVRATDAKILRILQLSYDSLQTSSDASVASLAAKRWNPSAFANAQNFSHAAGSQTEGITQSQKLRKLRQVVSKPKPDRREFERLAASISPGAELDFLTAMMTIKIAMHQGSFDTSSCEEALPFITNALSADPGNLAYRLLYDAIFSTLDTHTKQAHQEKSKQMQKLNAEQTAASSSRRAAQSELRQSQLRLEQLQNMIGRLSSW